MAFLTGPSQRPLLESMEARILHSADIAPLLLEPAAVNAYALPDATRSLAEAKVQRSEIVFVDAAVPDSDNLLNDLQSQRDAGRVIEIVRIAEGVDGIALITTTLDGRSDISAVHVIAHGADGQVQLGSVTLNAQTLLVRADEVAAWGAALTDDADLLLYGCDVAQTALGQGFVSDLAALTGADVAASTDLTGAYGQGGNWALEYSVGTIDAALAPTLAAQERWQGVMATYTVTTTLDAVGSGLLPGSLRWAITQANNNPGIDTITFAVDGTFSMTTLVSGDDSNGTGDFDISGSVNIVGNGSAKTIINGNGIDRVFDLRSGTINLSGVTLQNGSSNEGAGLRVNSSVTATLTDVVIQNNLGNGSSKGGGIYNKGVLTINDSVIRNNGDTLSGNIDGAGIFTDGTLTLRNVEVRDNIAHGDKDGGGIYIKDGAVTLENVTVAGNLAKFGGGIFNKTDGVTLTNVTLSGNSATAQGGGLWTDSRVSLNHVTVAGNTAGAGAGVYSEEDDVTMRDSLFAGNTGGNTNRALISAGYNLSDDASFGFNGVGDQKSVAAGLLPLADNGGKTRTHALGVGSAALDKANLTTALLTDQRGIAYWNGRADIGAYEYNPSSFSPTISAVANQTIDEDSLLGPLAFTIGDPESGAASLVVTVTSSNTTLVPNASIVLGGTDANRFVSLTPALNANGSNSGGLSTITLTVSDGANSTSTTFTVTVLAVNDAPAVSVPTSQVTDEDIPLVLAGGNALSVNDVDAEGAAMQVTVSVTHGVLSLRQTTGLSFVSGTGTNNASMTFSGTQLAINTALDGLTYLPTANFNGSAQIDLVVNDLGNTGSGGARLANGYVLIAVNAVNDAPVLALPGEQSTPLSTALNFSSASGNAITISDVDATATDTIELTVSTANAAANGTLTFGSTGGLVVSGNNTATVVLRGYVADLNAALDTLSFTDTGSGSAQVDFRVDDLGNTGAGGSRQTLGALAITVDPNQLPVLTLQATSVVFVENEAPIVLDKDLLISDVDDGTLASATVRIDTGYAGPQDVLQFTNDGASMGSIVASYSMGVLSMSSSGASATLGQWQAALRSVTYFNSSDSPATISRTLVLVVNDGLSDSAVRTLSLTVSARNDAPVLSGANNLASISEDPLVNDGTLVSTLIAGYHFDADVGALSGIAVTGFNGTSGVWQFTVDAGVTWVGFGTVSDAQARLLGVDANTAVRFVPAPDWNGSVVAGLTFRAWDQSVGTAGGVGDATVNGGVTAFSALAQSSSVTVRPQNDAPATTAVTLSPIAEDSGPRLITQAELLANATDIEGDNLVASALIITSGEGTLGVNGNGTWTYSPAPNDDSSVSFSYIITDNGTTAGAADPKSVTGSATLGLTPVNDAPTTSLVTLTAIAEDSGPRLITQAELLANASDVDGPSLIATGLGINSGTGALINNGNGTWTYTPAPDDDTSVSFSYTVTDGSLNVVGSATLDITPVNDAPTIGGVTANTAILDTGTARPFSGVLIGDLDSPAQLQSVTITLDVAAQGALSNLGGGSYNAVTGVYSFSGTAAAATAAVQGLVFTPAPNRVSPGNSEVTTFALSVNDGVAGAVTDNTTKVDSTSVNTPPQLLLQSTGAFSAPGSPLLLQLPAATFVDPDVGDALSYTATRADGTTLPAWLIFNPATLQFTGTPGVGDAESVAVRVVATDLSGASASMQFAIQIVAVSVVQAPTVDVALVSPPAPLAPVKPEAELAQPAPSPEIDVGLELAPALLTVATLSFDELSNLPVAVNAFTTTRGGESAAIALTSALTSPADTVLAAALLNELSGIASSSITQILHNNDLLSSLEALRGQMQALSGERHALVASSIAVSSGLSIGYVIWLVRGGVLVSSMLSALPAWQLIDPLPVMATATGKKRKTALADGDDPDFERLFDGAKPVKAAVPLEPGATEKPTHTTDAEVNA